MEETKKCPYCGEEILSVAKKCKYCGEWLENTTVTKKAMIACPICGEQIEEGTEICPYCHEHLESSGSSTKPTFDKQSNAESTAGTNKPIANTSELSDKQQAATDKGVYSTHTDLGQSIPYTDKSALNTPTNSNQQLPNANEPAPEGFFSYYFVDAFFKHYADFDGTMSRKQYWLSLFAFYFIGAPLLFLIICGLIVGYPTLMIVGAVLFLIYSIALFIPSLACAVRRLHDIGKSGSWYCVVFIPIVGYIWLFVLLCTKGKGQTKSTQNNAIDLLLFIIIPLAIFIELIVSFSGGGHQYNDSYASSAADSDSVLVDSNATVAEDSTASSNDEDSLALSENDTQQNDGNTLQFTISGHIGNYPIIMYCEVSNDQISGYYYNTRVGDSHKIYFSGTVDSDGNAEFSEQIPDVDNATFSGTFTGKSFSGTWTSASGNKVLDVNLDSAE